MDESVNHDGLKEHSGESSTTAILEHPVEAPAATLPDSVREGIGEQQAEDLQDTREELREEIAADNHPNKFTSRAPFKDEVFNDEFGRGTLNSVHLVTEGRGVLKAPLKDFHPFPSSKIKTLRNISLPMGKAHDLATKVLNNPDRMSMAFYDADTLKKTYLEEYGTMKRYFDYDDEHHETRDELLRDLRDPASSFYQDVLAAVKNEQTIPIIADAFEEHKDESFLVPESLVIGHPHYLTPEQLEAMKAAGERVPVSGYIYQEKVDGDDVRPLDKITDEDMTKDPELNHRLLAVALLQRKLYADTGLLADTRPEDTASHPFDWYQSTGNILIADGHPVFVDNHWHWDSSTRFIGRKDKRGVHLIDFLGRRSVDRAIRRYVSHLVPDSAETEDAA